MSRFDYVAYDSIAIGQQKAAKEACAHLELIISACGPLSDRASKLALQHLEECYMWIGKAIRDDQLARSGCVVADDKPWEPIRK